MLKLALVLALVLEVACSDSIGVPGDVQRAPVRSAGRFVVAASDSVVASESVAGQVSLLGCGEPPVGLTGFWTPTATELGALEAALPTWLESHIAAIELPLDKRDVYVNRQYVGMYRAGRRVVLINGWHKVGERDRDLTKDQLLISCGGGSLNFRLLFDVAAKRFNNFQGNGPM